LDEVLDAAYSDELNDQQFELVTKGMETMDGGTTVASPFRSLN
jgi:hypothetical protein